MAAKILLTEVDGINDITPALDFSGKVMPNCIKPVIFYSRSLDHNYASMDLEGGWEVG